MGTIKTWEPVRSQVPITLFDRYEVEIYAGEYRASGFLLSMEIYFLDKVPANVLIDTIPILLIDSVCFVGECLDSALCLEVKQPAKIYSNRVLSGDSVFQPRKWLDSDLWESMGVLVPVGFYADPVYDFKNKCYGPSILMGFEARMVDRRTSRELARETKFIKFEIRKNPLR